MNKWFYFNAMLLFIALWKLINKHFFGTFSIHLLFGMIGLLVILFNWTRHAVFSTIRQAKDRATKIKYANISKKVVNVHRWTGTSALLIIGCHAFLTIRHFGMWLPSMKMISGLCASAILLGVVTSGWLRRFWPSPLKRYVHLYLGFFMVFTILWHILV